MADKPELKPPFAIPKLGRDASGQVTTIFVDAVTGEPINDLKGYTVLTQAEANVILPENLKSNLDTEIPEDVTTPTRTERALAKDTHTNSMDNSRGKANQNINENFGFVNKPGLVGAGLSLAGPFGKLANAGWNMKNATAVNTARTALGLDNPTGKARLKADFKGAVQNNKGQVSNAAKIGPGTYHIGFNALSPDGKTNMTVNEAQNRARALDVSITEDSAEKAAADKSAKKGTSVVGGAISKVTGIQPGFLGRALDKAFGVTPADKAVQEAKNPTAKISPVEKMTGIKPGWATRALDKAFGIDNPPAVNTTPAVASNPNTVSPSVKSTDTSGVGFVSNFGQHRPNMPSNTITNSVKSAVANTFGTGYSVVGISGTEGDGPQYGSPRHKTGLALDFDVRDPLGNKVTDKNKLNDLASNFAFDNPEAGVGFGVGYMTDENGLPGRMHLDVSGLGKAWGAKNTRANMERALAETIDAARAGYRPTPFSNPPTPTPKPSQVNDPVGESLNPLGAVSLMDTSAPKANFAQQTIANTISNPTTPAPTTPSVTAPAGLAAFGMISRSPTERAAIARTIAGELSPSALKGLAVGDPDATNEFANMVATMENRAASVKFSTLQNTLTPSQYSSLAASNKKVTDQNYKQFASVLDNALTGFYSGQITPSIQNATNYFNPSIVNPGWASALTDTAKIGEHVFGALGEYGISKDTLSRMSMANERAAEGRDNSNNFGYSTLGGPGYTPGGMNSPSNSSYSGSNFGSKFGSSLGQGGIGSDRGSSSRASSSLSGMAGIGGFGNGGIGSDRGSSSRAGSSNTNSTFGGGIGSDRGSASRASSSGSANSASTAGGGIGSDRGSASRAGSSGSSKSDKGGGGIGHA